MLRQLIPLTLAAALLAPLAASAQTPPSAPPTAPPAPAAPPAPKNATHVNGKISSVDAAAKTVTFTRGKNGKTTVTLSVPDGTKIYKAGDKKKTPTGTFADLTAGVRITATTDGNADAPIAKEVHIRGARPAAPAAPPAPAAPVPPAAP